jgi:beta-lactamase superfamily II metal-dependent hydrolase
MGAPNSKATVEIIKAGHHGSHFATHEDMLHLQPQYFVFSAGGGHGHPSKHPIVVHRRFANFFAL